MWYVTYFVDEYGRKFYLQNDDGDLVSHIQEARLFDTRRRALSAGRENVRDSDLQFGTEPVADEIAAEFVQYEGVGSAD